MNISFGFSYYAKALLKLLWYFRTIRIVTIVVTSVGDTWFKKNGISPYGNSLNFLGSKKAVAPEIQNMPVGQKKF